MRNSVVRIRLCFLAALSALVATNTASAGPFQDETVLVPVPKGFAIATQGDQGAMTIAEYVPQGEMVSNWSQMVTVQIFHNLKSVDPDRFAEGIKSQWLAHCAGSEVHKVKDGQENGYKFSLWLFACPMNTQTGKPENMFNKLISGNDSLYSVQYAYRSELTKEIIVPTVAYLASIHACDTRLADRQCPIAMP
jgi:hypothetical protein